MLSRRAFLGVLAVLGVSAPVVAQAKAPAPVATTLTGRIVKSLTRRRALGQQSATIVVSEAGYTRILQEHGWSRADGLPLMLRQVPVVERREVLGEDNYWVTGHPVPPHEVPPVVYHGWD